MTALDRRIVRACLDRVNALNELNACILFAPTMTADDFVRSEQLTEIAESYLEIVAALTVGETSPRN